MNKYTTFFEDVLKMIAPLTLILLICGYVDIKTYYRYFGINISSYISSSEILITSLDNLLIVIISLMLQLIIWLSFFKYLFEYTQEDVNKYWEKRVRPKEFSDDLTIIRLLGSKRIRLFLLILFSASIIVSTIKLLIPANTIALQLSLFLGINLWIAICIYLLWLPMTRVLLKIAKNQTTYHPRLIVSFTVLLPTLILTIWVKNQMFIGNQIRKYGTSHQVEMQLQNGTKISTNDSIRYLGKTENYTFFWNKNTWASIIIPASQIKQINIDKN